MTIALAGLFGLIIGSFLNVVVLRMGTGKTLGGRSACMSCGKTLEWYELIPVFSWILQRGKCRGCGSAISPQYALVEASTAVLFACAAGTSLSLLSLAVALLIIALLIVIATYDMLHTIIPDAYAFAFAGASMVFALVQAPLILPAFVSVLEGLVVPLPLFLIWLVSKGRWMGFGDIKLAVGIGFLLGPLWGGFALYLAFVIGALVCVGVLVPLPYIMRWLEKRGITRLSMAHADLTMKSEVPFGPFLIAGCLVAWGMALYGIPFPFFA